MNDQEQYCPVCYSINSELFAKSYDVEYHTLPNEFRFLKCICGVVYLEYPPTDQLSVIYPSTYYSYGRKEGFVHVVKRSLDKRKFRSWSRHCRSESIALLDIGGGDGIEAATARAGDNRISKTVVVDIDETARERAELRGNEFVCNSIEEFFPDTQFDLVLALNLIEHVADPRGVLLKANSLMKSDGMILLKTPNYDSLDCRFFKNNNWGGFHTPRHWILFNKETISNLLYETGFQEVSVKYTQGGPFWTIGLYSVLTRVLSNKSKPSKIITQTHFFKFLMPLFASADLIRSILGFQTSQMFITARKN